MTQRIHLPNTQSMRHGTRAAFLLAVLVAAVARLGLGSACSFGLGGFTLTCPLGYLQMALASRSLLPKLLASAGVVLILAALLGRTFCGWLCPAGWLGQLFRRGKGRPTPGPKAQPRHEAPPVADEPRWARTTRYAVLGGTLVASFIFRFPVFCAVCPVGLAFGLLYAVIGLFATHQPTLDLLYFPLLLGLELVVLRSWCRSFCPLGTLLGLIGSRSRLLLPLVDRVQCFASQSIGCQVCAKACTQGIDLKTADDRTLSEDCTRCYECADDCPREAIGVQGLPVRAKTRPAGG